MLFVITNRTWHQEILEKVKPFGILFLMIDHESDLVVERQVVPEGEKLAAASLGAHYVEIS